MHRNNILFNQKLNLFLTLILRIALLQSYKAQKTLNEFPNIVLDHMIQLSFPSEEQRNFSNIFIDPLSKVQGYSWNYNIKMKDFYNLCSKLEKLDKADFDVFIQVNFFDNSSKKFLLLSESDKSNNGNIANLGKNIKNIQINLNTLTPVKDDMFEIELYECEDLSLKNLHNKRTGILSFYGVRIDLFILVGSTVFIFILLIVFIWIIRKNKHLRRTILLIKKKQEHFKSCKIKEVKAFCQKYLIPGKYNEMSLLCSYGDELCAICLETLKVCYIKNIVRLNCGHMFHKDCIYYWMETKFINPYCPICHVVIFRNCEQDADYSVFNGVNHSMSYD